MNLNKNDNDTATAERVMLVGTFSDRDSTERAFTTLHDKGYTNDDINLIMSDETRKKHFTGEFKNTEVGTKAAEGAGKGSMIGGTIGAVAGLLAAIGTSLVVPGLGLVIVGPLAAGLTGAGVGSVSGGIIGGLVGAGIPDDKAKEYETSIKSGRIFVGVHPRNEEDARFFEGLWSPKN